MLDDRGKYVHPSFLTVDPGLIDEINGYIKESPRTVLTFTELCRAFAPKLAGTQILNRYALQGALQKYGCPCSMKRDYVTRDPARTLTEEFEQYVRECGYAERSTLMDEFRVDEIRLDQMTARCPEILTLGRGRFMYSTRLSVSAEERESMRTYLSASCAGGPVSVRMLLDDFGKRFSDFTERNQVGSFGDLYGILRDLFRSDFSFSRPFISLQDRGR